MKITIIGIGHVGLVTAVTFAKRGFYTICADIIEEKVRMLNLGQTVFFEPGMKEEIKKTVENGLLVGSTDTICSVVNSDISFICVGTPSTDDGVMSLEYVENAAKEIGLGLKDKKDYHVVVVKSTVVPSTTDSVILPILEKFSRKKVGRDFGLCVNPEFLREGKALQDSLNPDRIVIGEYDRRSGDVLSKLYKNFKCPRLRVDLKTAEMIKYTSNAFLATKISFANEIANICEQFGVDVYQVMKGVGLDSRINRRFFRAGCGFGGSCFSKDLKALIASAKSKDYEPKLLKSVIEVNEKQPLRLVRLAESAIGSLRGKRIVLLGLSFKPDTDDVRETRALPIAKALLKKKARVIAYDPKAMENFKKMIEGVEYATSAKEALKKADGCIIQSEWQEFKDLKPKDFNVMKNRVVIDGRRTFDPEKMMRAGIVYKAIGWKNCISLM